MLASLLERGLNWMTERLHPYVLLQISLLLPTLIAYIAWRTLRFTIKPLLYPHDPQELPYWIPFFGHAKGFLEDSHQLVARGVELCENDKEPFALTIGGELFYVLPSPADAHTLFNNATTFSFDDHLGKAALGFGVDPKSIGFCVSVHAPKSAINPKGKKLLHLTEDLYKQQLLPGPNFDLMIASLEDSFQDLLKPSAVRQRFRSPTSLLDLCNILVDVTQIAIFDPVLYKLGPNMVKDMPLFTDEAWKLMYPSPAIDSSKVKGVRDDFIGIFKQYLGLPKKDRSKESWMITTVIDVYQDTHVQENDIAAVLTMIYWAAGINPYKLAFWMLSYILFDPKLHQTIKQETESAIKYGKIDVQHLVNHCPVLRSVYYECMRLTKRDVSMRKVTKDTVIGGKILRKGNFAFVPTCQLHQNGDTWGPSSGYFDAYRFVGKKELLTSPSYRPFGAGSTLCPGRFLTAPLVFSFIASLIHRWDIQLCDQQNVPSGTAWPLQFPALDDSSITFGISRPQPGSKVWVKLTPQKLL